MVMIDIDRRQMLIRARSGDERAIEEVLQWVVPGIQYKLSSKYYIPNCDADDIESVIRIAVFTAIRDFNPKLGKKFRAFALECAERRVIAELKAAQRQKRALPSGYSYLYLDRGSIEDGEDLHEKVGLPDPNIERITSPLPSLRECSCDDFRRLGLSKLEAKISELYNQGFSYLEIAEKLGRKLKSIDNGLCRSKRKIIAWMKENL